MELNLSILEGLLESAREERLQKYRKRREQIMSRMAVANRGVPPVVGSDGSLHAPFDGYLAFSTKTLSEEVYGGGQYIPCSLNDSEEDSHLHFTTRKIRIPASLFNEIKSSNGPLYHLVRWEGKRSWVDRSLGIEVINVWFHAGKWLLDQLDRIMEKFFEDVPKVVEPVKVKGVAPAGFCAVEGVVLAVKVQDSVYGPTLKMLVEMGNNATVWGTVPASLQDASRGANRELRGALVSFQANFETATGDVCHAFFKRPKGAKVVRWSEAVAGGGYCGG
jgi:hypothetical protein